MGDPAAIVVYSLKSDRGKELFEKGLGVGCGRVNGDFVVCDEVRVVLLLLLQVGARDLSFRRISV